MEKLNFLCGKWKMKRLAPCNLTNMSPRRGEGGGGAAKQLLLVYMATPRTRAIGRKIVGKKMS